MAYRTLILAALSLSLACSSTKDEGPGSTGNEAGAQSGGASGGENGTGGVTASGGEAGTASGGSNMGGRAGGSTSSAGTTSMGGSTGGLAGAPGNDTCESVSARYDKLVAPEAQTCTTDGECHLLDGHCGVGLGGCYHPASTTLKSEALGELATRWLGLGCNGPVCDCQAPPAAVGCSAAGLCEEKKVTLVGTRCCCEFLTDDIIQEDLKEPVECAAAKEGRCILVDPGRTTPHPCCPDATGATCGG